MNREERVVVLEKDRPGAMMNLEESDSLGVAPRYESSPKTPRDAFRQEDLDRRESVLNARIAEFENIVRKTKISAASRQEELSESEKTLAEKWEKLQAALDELTAKEAELDRRETNLAQREDILSERLEELTRRELENRRQQENFEKSSQEILEKIREQKAEVSKMLAAHSF